MPGPTDALGYSPGSPFYRPPSASGYNLNPAPTSGTGPFGQVPGQLGLPSPATDLGAQYPNLTGTNAALSNTILSKLHGNLSPGTLGALQTAAAQFGVRSGMPGSGLQMNNLFGNIAGFAENQAQQGLQDYASIIPAISGTQTVRPELQNEIALQNAVNAAAPNPAEAQTYAQRLFNNYLGSMQGGGRVSGLPTGQGSGADFVRRPFASQVGNPEPLGGLGRLGTVDTYSNQSNFGGYGGSSFGGAGGMDEYNWIANQGFNPADYGVQPGGGYTNITPNIGGGVQGPWMPQDYMQSIGPEPGSFQQQYPNLSGATDEDLAELGIG